MRAKYPPDDRAWGWFRRQKGGCPRAQQPAWDFPVSEARAARCPRRWCLVLSSLGSASLDARGCWGDFIPGEAYRRDTPCILMVACAGSKLLGLQGALCCRGLCARVASSGPPQRAHQYGDVARHRDRLRRCLDSAAPRSGGGTAVPHALRSRRSAPRDHHSLYFVYTLPRLTKDVVFGWLLIGLVIYFTYSIRNSKVQAMERSEGKLSAER